MAKGKAAKIEVEMNDPKPKKHVTRFDATDPKAVILNVYVNNEELAKIGNPDTIKVTVEAV